MNFKQLECFVKLAENLNFTRTAEILYISQPAITQQINMLESELDVKLFNRTKRKVELTQSGELFYHDIKKILTETNIAVAKIKKFSSVIEKKLSICYSEYLEMNYLSKVIEIFKIKMPDVYLYLKIVDYQEKRKLFLDSKIDLIFSVKEHIDHLENIKFEELLKGTYVCVMPKKYPLSNKSIISVNDLANHPIIALDPISCPAEMLRIYNNIRNNNPNDIKYFCDHPQTIFTMIKGGFGVSILPDFVCPNDPCLLLIPYETNERISYGIAWNKNYETKEIKTFIEISKTTCFIKNQL